MAEDFRRVASRVKRDDAPYCSSRGEQRSTATQIGEKPTEEAVRRSRSASPLEQAQRLAEVQSVYVFKSGPHSFSTACVVAPSSVRSSRVQTVRPAVQSR